MAKKGMAATIAREVANITGRVMTIEEAAVCEKMRKADRDVMRKAIGMRKLRQQSIQSMIEKLPNEFRSAVFHDYNTGWAYDAE